MRCWLLCLDLVLDHLKMLPLMIIYLASLLKHKLVALRLITPIILPLTFQPPPLAPINSPTHTERSLSLSLSLSKSTYITFKQSNVDFLKALFV